MAAVLEGDWKPCRGLGSVRLLGCRGREGEAGRGGGPWSLRGGRERGAGS